MIRSFADQGTEDVYHGKTSPKARKALPRTLLTIACRKLDMLDAAQTIVDMRIPPGNHLEALIGKLKGFHSIRINNQYRIIFKWSELGPEQVKIADYH